MKQGVLSNGRVRLLLSDGASCYRARRTGERKRKSVRGCIVGADLSVLNLVIVKKGDKDIPNVTDSSQARRLGPKRANKIRALFNLGKDEDVRKHVISRKFENKKGKSVVKRCKIQRLVTPVVLARKRRRITAARKSLENSKAEAAAYSALVQKRLSEQKEARRSEISKRRSSRKASHKD
jgi:small subunit ribosomal protein S6e